MQGYMKKTVIISFMIVLVTILSSFVTCYTDWEYGDKYDYYYVFNRSSDTVCAYFAWGNNAVSPYSYPDTILPKNEKTYKEAIFEVKPNGFTRFFSHMIPYKKHIEEAIMEKVNSDTLSVFFISKDSINKYGYDVVARDYNILVRYDLSVEDLKQVNCNIVYPPLPEMKDIKMYPPYATFRK